MSRVSFLISPPLPTRRSSTGKRSMREIPPAPVRSADQKASRSWPIGVQTPPARIAMRSLSGVGCPSDELPASPGSAPILKEGGVVHPERAYVARIGVEDFRREEAARHPVEGDRARPGGIVGVIDAQLEKAPLVHPVVVDDHGVVELDGGEVRDEE